MTGKIQEGDFVTVNTADGHRFRGRVLRLKTDLSARPLALLRLDTGWQVSYPLTMLTPEQSQPKPGAEAPSLKP